MDGINRLIVAQEEYNDIIEHEYAWEWLNEDRSDRDTMLTTVSADRVLVLLSTITGK
jgi:hypothetical protein